MCGIIGYIGKERAVPEIFDGLKKLEYRGYDSAGISVLSGGKLFTVKAKGKLDSLDRLLDALPDSATGIGHTRWATHGEPNELNSHPHLSDDGKFAIVHNGIIENADELRSFLKDRGFDIVSETDSEVIAHLMEYYYNGDALTALKKISLRLKGSYALAIVGVYNNELYAIKKDSPLIIGVGKTAKILSSDAAALPQKIKEYLIMDDNEIAIINENAVNIYNLSGEKQDKPYFANTSAPTDTSKMGYPHYMLKEIFEQPAAIERTVTSLSTPIKFPETFVPDSIILCGCGSAYNAALMSLPQFTALNIPVSVMYASEFRYCNPRLTERTLFIAVTQSGETADTLFSLRLAKQKGALTAAVVNVPNSSIYREADIPVQTKAGAEIAVATTKGFTTQLAALTLLARSVTLFAHLSSPEDYDNARSLLLKSAGALKKQLGSLSLLQKTANEICNLKNVFFIGRREDYALATEGALKLKEISYIHAESYPAGELKHGTISLIEKGSVCFAPVLCKDLKDKMLSNIKEIAARGGKTYVITPFADTFSDIATVITVPLTGAPYCASAVLQLISYYTAALRGSDIDKPRNLAKSVTVE